MTLFVNFLRADFSANYLRVQVCIICNFFAHAHFCANYLLAQVCNTFFDARNEFEIVENI